MSRPTTDHLTALAGAIVTDGFAAHEPGVAALVAHARRLGVCAVLTDVVADAAAPRPVRERALGRVVVALAAIVDAPPTLVTAGAASAA